MNVPAGLKTNRSLSDGLSSSIPTVDRRFRRSDGRYCALWIPHSSDPTLQIANFVSIGCGRESDRDLQAPRCTSREIGEQHKVNRSRRAFGGICNRKGICIPSGNNSQINGTASKEGCRRSTRRVGHVVQADVSLCGNPNAGCKRNRDPLQVPTVKTRVPEGQDNAKPLSSIIRFRFQRLRFDDWLIGLSGASVCLPCEVQRPQHDQREEDLYCAGCKGKRITHIRSLNLRAAQREVV